MAEKLFSNLRVINKHDTETNWRATTFVPKKGEIVVYDADAYCSYARMKIGDGVTDVNALPFYTQDDANNVSTELFIVTLSCDNWDDPLTANWSADKTFAETRAAIDAGRVVMCSISHDGLELCLFPDMYSPNMGIRFAGIEEDGYQEFYVLNADNSVSCLQEKKAMPNAITFENSAGHMLACYSGNEEVTITIPDGDTTQVQADLSVNDPDDPAYVKNRTHYEERSVATIINDSAMPLMMDQEGLAMYASMAPVLHQPTVGEEYAVTVNGVTEHTICRYIAQADEAYWALGNSGMLDGTGDTGELFVAMFPDLTVMDTEALGGMTMMFIDLSGLVTGLPASPSIAVTMEGPAVVVHKIDEKYLPDSVFEPPSDWQAAPGENGHVLNRTHWYDPAGMIVLDEEFSASAGSTSNGSGFSGLLTRIAPNSTYIVKWGTTEYTCVAKKSTPATGYFNYPIYLGNGSKYHGAEDTGEPFCIFVPEDGSNWGYACYSNTPSISHITITVGPDGAYHQLDDRYVNIPEVITAQPDMEAAEDEPGHVLNRTHYVERVQDMPLLGYRLMHLESSLDGEVYGLEYNVPSTFEFVEGCTYSFTIDNVVYNYVAEKTGDSFRFMKSAAGINKNGLIISYHPDGVQHSNAASRVYFSVMLVAGALDSFADFTINAGPIVKQLDGAFIDQINDNIRNGGAEGSIVAKQTNSAGDIKPGDYSQSFGEYSTLARGHFAVALGNGSDALGCCSVATGNASQAEGISSEANNFSTKAIGDFSHAEGEVTVASGQGAHSSGAHTVAKGEYSHTEGVNTYAIGDASHAEGNSSHAVGAKSHSEASGVAIGVGSHAEGDSGLSRPISVNGGTADAPCEYIPRHASVLQYLFVGQMVTTNRGSAIIMEARKNYPVYDAWTWETFKEFDIAQIVEITDTSIILDHTLGELTDDPVWAIFGGSVGDNSHVEGSGTYAKEDNQHVEGKFNVIDEDGKYAHIVGNGRVVDEREYNNTGTAIEATYSKQERSNAHTVAWDGTGWFAGDVKVGGTGQDDADAKTLATQEYVDQKLQGGASGLPVTDDVRMQLVVNGDGDVTWEKQLAWHEGVTTVDICKNYELIDMGTIEPDMAGMLMGATPFDGDLVAGNSYTIIWGNNTYVSPTVLYVDGNVAMYILGNAAIMGDPNDLPFDNPDPDANFLLMYMPGGEMGAYVQAVFMDPAPATPMISIQGQANSFKTIDEQFLPDSVKKKTITLTIDENNNVTSDTPFHVAWAMTPAELQASIQIKTKDTSQFEDVYGSVETVGKTMMTGWDVAMIQIVVRNSIRDISDKTDWERTSRIQWTVDGLTNVGRVPGQPVVENSAYAVGQYLKFTNGWQLATVDELRDDLGGGDGIFVSGSAEGSVRSFNAVEEDDTYAMGENAFAFGPSAIAEGNNAIAFNGEARNGGFSFMAGGWLSTKIRGAANAVDYEFYNYAGDIPLFVGDTVSLDKENTATITFVSESAVNHWQHITLDHTLSATDLNEVQLYYYNGANGGISFGGRSANWGFAMPYSVAVGPMSLAFGSGSASGHAAISGGLYTAATGTSSMAIGTMSGAGGESSQATGYSVHAEGRGAHAEGYDTAALAQAAHSEGIKTWADGESSHAEGNGVVALGAYAHAEGGYGGVTIRLTGTAGATTYTWTSGYGDTGNPHGEQAPVRTGDFVSIYLPSHSSPHLNDNRIALITSVDGNQLTVDQSLADYDLNATSCHVWHGGIAQGAGSHIEGAANTCGIASLLSHAEGMHTRAAGPAAHAEGAWSIAKAEAAHAEGINTVAASKFQHVEGKGNLIDDANKYAHIVGNGRTYDDRANEINPNAGRSNAYTLDWDGNGWYAGTVEATGVIVKSSTPGSSKRFLLQVDDSGQLQISEVTP